VVEELDDREPATLTYEPTKNARIIRHTARGKTTAPALPLFIPGRIVPMLFKWVARILNAEKRSPRFQHPVPRKRECGWLGREKAFGEIRRTTYLGPSDCQGLRCRQKS